VREPSREPTASRRVTAAKRAAVSLVVGVPAALPLARLASFELWPLIAWDLTSLIYIAWVWRESWPLDGPRTARLAEQEDPTRRTVDLFLLTAAVVSLGAVGVALVRSGQGQTPATLLAVVLSVLTVVLSWALVNTVFALKYARLYYEGDNGGIDFADDRWPRYSDFAYMAFTIGMTSNVSDTDVQQSQIRQTVLGHSLLSYLFGTGVLAVAINLIANLSQSR
jgi:uncharacterized membrane protein